MQGSENGTGMAGSPAPSTETPDGRKQLEWVIDILYRRKWIVLGCLLIGVAIAAGYTLSQEPVFEARSFIMVDLSQGRSRMADLAAGEASFFSSNDRAMSDEIFVLQNSLQLAQRVAEGLKQEVEEEEGALPVMENANGEPRTVDEVAMRLPRHVSFRPVQGSASIVQINSSSMNSREARLIANLYAREYAELTQEARSDRAQNSMSFLQEQLEMRRQELDEAERELQSYMTANGTASLGQEGGGVVSRIAELEAQRDNLRLEAQMQENMLSSLRQSLDDLSPQIVNRLASGQDQKMSAVQERIALLEREREKIVSAYPDPSRRGDVTRSKLSQIDQELEDLQEEARRLAQEFVASGAPGVADVTSIRQQIAQKESMIDQIRSRINLVDNRLAESRAQLRELPEESMRLAQLQRSRMYAEQMHRLIAQRLLDARMQSEMSKGAGYVRIVREAVGSYPVRADAGRNMVLGIFLGLLFGLGAALTRDKVDNRIFKAEELRGRGYREIGVVPSTKPLIQEDFAGKEAIEQAGRMISTSLVALLSPASSVAEAYRSVKANLLHSRETRPRVIMVTSAGPAEGKSVTASNLAVLMARAGHRTLLIDADLRRPNVHKLFGIDSEPGLSRLLQEGVDFSAKDLETWVDNLYVMPAGRAYGTDKSPDEAGVMSPDELLESERMRALLGGFRETFDCVIIDTPPVLAATETTVLSKDADTTVVVVRAGRTKEGELEHAMEALSSVGADIGGVILNGFEVSMAFGYKYRYKSYSKYGHYSKYGYSEYADSRNGSSGRKKGILSRVTA